MQDYINWFRNASPYINAHRDCTFVVMMPGESFTDPNLSNIIYDLVLLHSLGVKLVLVHGSRPQIEERLAAAGINSRYHNDLRITDVGTMACVTAAVGTLRIAIEAQLSVDMASSPMQGSRVRVSSGNFVTARPMGVVDGVDFQHTGEVRRIDSKGIKRLLGENNVVLLSSLGYSPTGEVFNLSCEDVAKRAAIDLAADKLILYSETTGILSDAGQLLRELNPQQAEPHIRRLRGSMQGELLEAAVYASHQGVGRCHIISYRENGALLAELFTRRGQGTLVTSEPMESLRNADINDIGGLIDLIAPLEQQGILVHRSREVLEREIHRFTVIEREGIIIGCAALYPIPDSDAGELACLAVSSDYRHGDRGDKLLAHIENQAALQQIRRLFVLTTRTAHWFQQRGFKPGGVENLPDTRASLYNFQRNSKIFEKSIVQE